MNEKILASVNGKAITDADIDAFIAGMGQRGQAYQNPQGRAMILEQLINKSLLVLDATRNLYERDPEFKAQLARVKEDLLANYAVEKVVRDVRIKDEDVQKYYEDNKAQFVQGPSVNASHILVDSEDKANEILAKINANEVTFENAAKQFSTCPSAKEGGNLGDFTRGQMVPEFDEACFTMEVGELRGPIKTQFGYHLIRLNGKNEGKAYEFAEIKDQLREKLLSDKQQAAYQSKINQLKILYPVDKPTLL
ncbi:MAG: peptidylprolyl isomerase [Clostridia bacterium]|nr:peptidylprolyl isomerase [Clostridia bacterium]